MRDKGFNSCQVNPSFYLPSSSGNSLGLKVIRLLSLPNGCLSERHPWPSDVNTRGTIGIEKMNTLFVKTAQSQDGH